MLLASLRYSFELRSDLARLSLPKIGTNLNHMPRLCSGCVDRRLTGKETLSSDRTTQTFYHNREQERDFWTNRLFNRYNIAR